MLVNSPLADANKTSFSLNELLRQRANNIRDNNFKVTAFNNNNKQKAINSGKVQSFATMFTKLRKKMKNQIKNQKCRKYSNKEQIHSSVLLGKTMRNSFVQENKEQQLSAWNRRGKVKTVLSQSLLDFSNIDTIPKLHNLNNRKMSYSFYHQKICKGSTIGKSSMQNQNKSMSLKKRSMSKSKTQIQCEFQHNFVPLGKIKILSDSQRYLKNAQRQVNDDNIVKQNQVEDTNNKNEILSGTRSKLNQQDEQPLKQIYDKIFSRQHPQQTLLSKRRCKNGRKIYASHKLQLRIDKSSKFNIKQQSISNLDHDRVRERNIQERFRMEREEQSPGISGEIKEMILRSPLGPWNQQRF